MFGSLLVPWAFARMATSNAKHFVRKYGWGCSTALAQFRSQACSRTDLQSARHGTEPGASGMACGLVGWRYGGEAKPKTKKQTQVNWKSHRKARCHLNRTVVIHRVRCFFLSSLLQPHTGQIHLYKRNKKKRTRVSGHEDDAFAADLFLKPTRSKSFKATLSLMDTCPCDLARTTASKEKRGKTTPK